MECNMCFIIMINTHITKICLIYRQSCSCQGQRLLQQSQLNKFIDVKRGTSYFKAIVMKVSKWKQIVADSIISYWKTHSDVNVRSE